MRALLPALVLLTLLAPSVAAQAINPIRGNYGDIYVLAGRAVDAQGAPIVRGEVVAELDAPGVKAEPLRIGTDCYGFFIGYYSLRQVDAAGVVNLRVQGPNGTGKTTAHLDPFFRRSDLNVTYPGTWHGVCTDTQQAAWDSRVTIAGRVVKRVEPYTESGVDLQARPVNAYIHVALVLPDGSRFCPPSSQSSHDGSELCDPLTTDERGDFRYSWTFNTNFTAAGHIEITVGNRTFNATVDPRLRAAFAEIESTGQGAPKPEIKPAPALAPVTGAALVSLAALLVRRKR